MRRITGTGAFATMVLGVLALGCVFAVTAGPREVLAGRSQALRQTLAALPALSRTIAVTTTWTGVSGQLTQASAPGSAAHADLTAGQIGEIAGQLHDELNQGVVRLAPASTDWAALTSHAQLVLSPVPAVSGFPVELEVSYRQPFAQYMRLVAGRFPGPPVLSHAPAPPPLPQGVYYPGRQTANSGPIAKLLEVVVTPQTASRFGLRVGSALRVASQANGASAGQGSIALKVSGIVVPRDPSSTFWTADETMAVPGLDCASCTPPYTPTWVGGVFAGSGATYGVQRAFGPAGLTMQWEFPVQTGWLGGQQARPLDAALNLLGAASPRLTGDVAPVAPALAASSTGLTAAVAGYLATADAVDTLLWLVYVSLAVAGMAVLLLAARMVALRRSAELAVRRARGASLRHIALTTAAGAGMSCVPAAVIGAALAVLAVPAARLGPGGEPVSSWWPPVVVLLVAVCAPGAIAAWQQRLPHRRRRARARVRVRGRRPPTGQARLVVEATATAIAVAGILVFRQQGTQAGTGVNLYTSAVPVLIAVPAVIVMLRIYPLVLRALLRGSARRQGATGFLGLARAARTALTPALPALALVLALSVSAFSGMIRGAVTRAEIAASWQAAGADATITAATISPAAQRAAEAVPGVTRAATVWQTSWATSDGTQLAGLAVDPASYAALVAATQTFPRVSSGLVAAAPAGTAQPVLASPQAAADLGRGTVTITPDAAVGPLSIRVAGVLSGTPALPGGGAFVIIPLSAVRSAATPPRPPAVNELLLAGQGIDTARLAAVVKDMIPLGSATIRSDILNSLTTAPLQHGAFVLLTLALIAAAVLGLAVLLFELALGAAEREAALARLAVMGLAEGQRARVVALEVLPAVIAAAAAAVACALATPWLVAPDIDLSVFSGSSAPTTLVPDVTSVAVPLAGLAVLAMTALAIQVRSGRRGVAASLRTGG
jgi:putative ABC transport system permease protein